MSTPFLPALRPLLAPMGRRQRHPGRCLQAATLSQVEQTLAPALPAGLFQKPSSGPHSRQRVFDLARTFWCWIWQVFQANTSCREVVRQIQALRGILEQSPIDEDNSAYCQARLKLSLPLLQKIFLATAQSAQQNAPRSHLLQGRPLKMVDGATVRLEDTPKNRQAFPPSSNQFCRPAFPLMKLVVLFSLASGAVLAHATGCLQQSEMRLLLSLATHLQPGDVVCADRAFCQYVLLHWLRGLQVDAVARVNTLSRRVDFRQAIKKLGPGDGLFLWHKPNVPSKLLSAQQWAQVPETMIVRLVQTRINKPGFRTRHLTAVTTLLDAQKYPAHEILQAYLHRWRLELCVDDLKTTLGMEKLRCRTPDSAQRELLVFLSAHNFIRWIMAQAACHSGAHLERISFKGSLDAFRQWSMALVQVRGRSKVRKQKILWHQLLDTLAADLVPYRPGRQEPRAVKKRSKYPRLTQPRQRYVERWSRNKRRRVARAKRRQQLN